MGRDGRDQAGTGEAVRLAEIERLLRASSGHDLAWERRAVLSREGERMALVIKASDTPGVARVFTRVILNPHPEEDSAFALAFELAAVGPGMPRHAEVTVEHIINEDAEPIMAGIAAWRADWAAWRADWQASVCDAPALGDADLAPLQELAAARRRIHEAAAALEGARGEESWHALGLMVAFDPDLRPGELTADGRARLAADLHHLDAAQVLANLPRDAQGRLALGETALLAAYESVAQQGRGRAMWLAIHTPARRRDGQTATLTLESLIGENHAHRWDGARWLWDARAAAASEAERWGVADLDVARLGMAERSSALEHFARRSAEGDHTAADRAGYAIVLLDEGRIEEAFAACGVELDDEVRRLVRGQIRSYGVLQHENGASWVDATRRELRAAAPWRFMQAIVSEGATRRTRGSGSLRLRLFSLPHQPYQSKESLMLVGGGRNARPPQLQIEATSWNYRLPVPLWKRPVELELRRFGLER